jgi:hypothetical protein
MIPLRWTFPSPRRLLTSLNLLRVIWIFVFYCLEHHNPQHAIKTCSWPLDGPRECRLAVIADPQIVDENTYSRRGIAMWLTKTFTDRYMRRNYRYLMNQNPGTVVFLGDLMDGGREWDDEKYVLHNLNMLILDGFLSMNGFGGYSRAYREFELLLLFLVITISVLAMEYIQTNSIGSNNILRTDQIHPKCSIYVTLISSY